MYVASDPKDWDTYLPSDTYDYYTSLSETTSDTPFVFIYDRESLKLLDVPLLPPMIESRSEKVGHKIWIYSSAVKQRLPKKLCSLWYRPFCLAD